MSVHRITQKVWVDFGEIFKVDNFGMEMKSLNFEHSAVMKPNFIPPMHARNA